MYTIEYSSPRYSDYEDVFAEAGLAHPPYDDDNKVQLLNPLLRHPGYYPYRRVRRRPSTPD
jgi:hypothetical protein